MMTLLVLSMINNKSKSPNFYRTSSIYKRGAVLPTDLEIISGQRICLNDGSIQNFYLEFPSDQVTERDLDYLEELVMKDGYLNDALGTMVLELEISGRRPLRQDGAEPSKNRTSKGGSAKQKMSKKSPKNSYECYNL